MNFAYESTFSHNDVDYSIATMLRLIDKEKISVTSTSLSSLRWALDQSPLKGEEHEKRIEDADMNFPIIIGNLPGRGSRVYIFDGLHRANKALRANQKNIDVYFLDAASVEMCRV